MQVCYYDTPMIEGKRSIFLAGPTVRVEQQGTWKGKFWRDEALKFLEQSNFDGIVYVPECSKRFSHTYSHRYYFGWEWRALHMAGVILFYVPRKFPELPGLTTNVEFGYYNGIGKKVVYGRPNGAYRTQYLDKLYDKVHGKKPKTDIKSLVQEAIFELDNKI